MYAELLIFLSGLMTTFLSLPVLMEAMRTRGFTGRDVHKKDEPEIPEMGGVAILIGVAASGVVGSILMPDKTVLFFSFISTVLVAGVVGFIDDIRPLNARVKPLLTLLASVPILVTGTYTPNIVFPIIGGTRLTVVYPVLIPIVMAVTSNAVNMMDPFNGVMSGTSTVITVALLIAALALGLENGEILCVMLLGSLVAFYYFNRYPSRVFSGDVGSLCVGTALGAIAIMGRLEVVAVVAFMPQIMNAFYGISSMMRLYERREVARPVEVLEDGRLMARDDPGAPLTLARFILARGPLGEAEAARVFIILSVISGLLAIVTAYLIAVAS
jgi:UDP-N-acetylglucosamine--dolichyl-phosphate N-acetylglucosaminephosphotransferase